MVVKPIKTETAGVEVVKGYRLVSSYSQIDKYTQCPFSWFLKYIENVPADIKSKALEYGLAVHETMEYYFEMARLGIFVPHVDLIKFFSKAFKDREIPFDDVDEEKDYFNEGITAIGRIYSPVNEVEKIMVDPGTEILGVEEDFELEIELIEPVRVAFVDEEGNRRVLETDKVYIVGFIDLVLRTKEGIVVIDHKSGKSLYPKHKLEVNLQFPIYGMAVLQKYGELPIRYYYNFTKLHKCQVLKLEKENDDDVVLNEARIIRSKAEIIRIFRKMNIQTLPRIYSEDGISLHTAKPSHMCYWCDYSLHKLNICETSSNFKPKKKNMIQVS